MSRNAIIAPPPLHRHIQHAHKLYLPVIDLRVLTALANRVRASASEYIKPSLQVGGPSTCEMANDYETRRSGNGTSCYGDEKPRFVRYALPTDEESNFLYLVRRVYEVNDEPEDMVKALRIRLTEDYGPTWHVIIGEGIAGYVGVEVTSRMHRLSTSILQ